MVATSGPVPLVPPTAVTYGHEPGKIGVNLVALLPSFVTQEAPGPESPLATSMLTPLAPKAPNVLHTC